MWYQKLSQNKETKHKYNATCPSKRKSAHSFTSRPESLLVGKYQWVLSALLPKSESILKGHNLLHHFCLSLVILLCALDLPGILLATKPFLPSLHPSPLTLITVIRSDRQAS